MFGVQLYKNNARALLSRILSILNLDWLLHARSVRGVYEMIVVVVVVVVIKIIIIITLIIKIIALIINNNIVISIYWCNECIAFHFHAPNVYER